MSTFLRDGTETGVGDEVVAAEEERCLIVMAVKTHGSVQSPLESRDTFRLHVAVVTDSP